MAWYPYVQGPGVDRASYGRRQGQGLTVDPGFDLGLVRVPVHGASLAVFIFFFLAVTVMGFLASRWRRPENEHSLDE